MRDNLLIVFTKYPEPGRVKTRLAEALGEAEAARVYRAAVKQVIAAAARGGAEAGYDAAVAYWPADSGAAMRQWLGSDLPLCPQQGSDLGQRLRNAFADGFAQGYARVTIIGSDCPDVTQTVIIEAFRRLGRHDAVMGPAADGGYYLIGLTHPAPELFEGVDWGTEHVLRQTIERCSALKLAYELLPELRDIDRIDDLNYYRARGVLL